MHKSALTFGLLASSIVMLAIMPFLNQNNFSNATAQEYGQYEDNNSYMADDISEQYDTYSHNIGAGHEKYKPEQYPTQHPQKPYQIINNYYYSYPDKSYSNDHSYSSDYVNGKYSKYPTMENNYECRTGPFEGFFVSSVEFCKHIKFDDKKRDSKIGPPGPQGPQGVQGIQGPRGFNGTDGVNGTQGPPGPNRIDLTSVYTVRGNIDNTTGDGIAISTANCTLGDTVLSGSYTLSPSLDFEISDGALVTQDGWFTRAVGAAVGDDIVGIQTFAQCFNNP
jgi:hypothetical protein